MGGWEVGAVEGLLKLELLRMFTSKHAFVAGLNYNTKNTGNLGMTDAAGARHGRHCV